MMQKHKNVFQTKFTKGAGLGLSTSYGIVEKHDGSGSIMVESEVETGKIFTITLLVVRH